MKILRVLCVAVSLSALALAAHASPTSWSLVNDFSIAQNPNGVWSYGFFATGVPPLTLYGDAVTNSPFVGARSWYFDDTNPDERFIIKNESGSTANYDSFVSHPVNVLNLHGGVSDDPSIARWTAPVDGTYSVTADFSVITTDPSGNFRDVALIVDGVTIGSATLDLFSQTSASYSTGGASLQAGDIVDYVVTYAGSEGHTGVSGTISLVASSANISVSAPQTTVVGTTATYSVAITSAQPTDTFVTLSSEDTSLVTVPPNVMIPAGELNATFDATAVGVGGPVTITATLPGGTIGSDADATSLTVTGIIVSFTPANRVVRRFAAPSYTVNINQAQFENVVVTLSSSDTSIAIVQPTVTILSGNTSATFSASGLDGGVVTITATLPAKFGGDASDGTLTVVSVEVDPHDLSARTGTLTTINVEFKPARPTPTTLTLSSDNPSVAAATTNQIVIPPGETSGSFMLEAKAPGQARVKAAADGSLDNAFDFVNTTVSEVTLAMSPSSATAGVGGSAQFTLTLGSVQGNDTDVSLTSSNPGVATVPGSVRINSGQTTGQFSATAAGTGVTTITASLPAGIGGATTSSQLNVTGTTIVLTPSTQTVGLGAVNLAVSIGAAQPGDTTITLTSTNPGAVSVPATITIGAGQTSRSINATALATGSSTLRATLPASLGGASSTATVIVEVRQALVSFTVPPPILQTAGSSSTSSVTYLLSNLGDVATVITLTKENGDFFTQTPESFPLAPGATQLVTVTGTPQALPSTFRGFSIISGDGVPASARIPITLFAAAPSGLRINDVVTLTPRVDISAPENQNLVPGTAVFKNIGATRAEGVVSADVLWILPEPGVIGINPGEEKIINFQIDRSKRPDAANLNGTASGTLSFVYPAGAVTTGKETHEGELAGQVPVIVNDTAPPGSPQNFIIPPLVPPDVALYIPGVGHVTGGGNKLFISDFSLTNGSIAPINDLKYYFVPRGGSAQSATKVDSKSVSASSNQTLADIVTTTFKQDNQLGVLQIRSKDVEQVSVSANVFVSNDPKGTFGTSIPVFRSDRAIGSGQIMVLTGLRKDASFRTNIYIQETSGNAASGTISYRDRTGREISSAPVNVGAFSVTIIGTNEIPDGVVTAFLTNTSGGKLATFATPVDNLSGDTWGVADWNRYYNYARDAKMIVPIAGSLRGAGNLFFRTDLTILNGGASTTTLQMRYVPSSGSAVEQPVTITAGETRIFEDVIGANFSQAGAGYLVITPATGSNVTVTSRTYATKGDDPATFGTAVPTLPATAALTMGKSKVFGGLKDAAPSKVGLAGATFRLNLGLMEVTGQPVTLRVSLLLPDGRKLAGGFSDAREYQLGANEFRQISGIVGDVLGATRRNQLGDINSMQLKVEVIGGTGGVITYTSLTDNGTGDTVLRVE